jgi:hypothetical protein
MVKCVAGGLQWDNKTNNIAGSDMSSGSYDFDRVPYTIAWREKPAFKETYGGRSDGVAIEGLYFRPSASAPRSKTILLFMHPSGLTNGLPLTNALPKAGIPCCARAAAIRRTTAR